MRHVLHILTKPNDVLASEMVARQKATGQYHLEVQDLTRPDPDYRELLEAIFRADSVQVW